MLPPLRHPSVRQRAPRRIADPALDRAVNIPVIGLSRRLLDISAELAALDAAELGAGQGAPPWPPDQL